MAKHSKTSPLVERCFGLLAEGSEMNKAAIEWLQKQMTVTEPKELLARVEARIKKSKAKIEAAQIDLEEWEAATAVIDPLLEANPGWTWRDAVAHLKANGRLSAIIENLANARTLRNAEPQGHA